MIHRGFAPTGRMHRGSVAHNDNRPSEKPRPKVDAEELVFNELLAQGIKAINDNKGWLHLFLRCPLNRWFELYSILMAAKHNRDSFLS